MGFQCGIVGLPNVGKSTIFNALTSGKAEAANFPFCTIEPNTGIIRVPDPRLNEIAKYIKTKAIIPTQMTFVDIAGLVKGASQGEGLGNQFLAHIRETDAIAHVVRCFDDPNVIHVDGSVNPERDVSVIDMELILADLETVNKRYTTLQKAAQARNKEAALVYGVLERVKPALESGKPVRALGLTEEELLRIRDFHLITAKKVMYVANVNEEYLSYPEKNPYWIRLQKYAQTEGASVVAISGKLEAEIAQLDESERASFLKDLGMSEPGLNRVIRTGYDLLGLKTFFTAGDKEIRAWTFHCGWLAPQCAGVIHTDFERGFIKAEVYRLEDLKQYHSEAAIREAGLLRLEGKEYMVQDGDIIFFRFAV